MTQKAKTALDYAYEWEVNFPDKIYMTQPLGTGALKNYTWKETMTEARKMASYLKKTLPPKSHVASISKNCAHWIILDLAVWMADMVSVPLYPTLAEDTVRQILTHSDSKILFVGKLDDWNSMKNGVPKDMPMIAFPLAPKNDYKKWDDITKNESPLQENVKRDPAEMATIVYTSGSTGTPKGAMLDFKSMTHAAEGVKQVLGTTKDDRMLSYLPLSHVFERWIVEMGSLVAGFHVYFAESLDTFVQDLQRATPTLFVSVPRLWNKFQMGVSQKMPEKKLKILLSIPLLNKVIKKKILTKLGLQEVRFAGTGSAPIPEKLVSWYRDLGLELLEGYGMTENFCYSHVSMPGRSRIGYVGNTYPGVECRISQEGEILVKSPGSMMGYYKEDTLTKESFTNDGFLKTGDRGEIDNQGRLKITGRVKELFKTSKGKYVAPAPIENKLLVHPQIEMCCVGGAGRSQPFGLVHLSDEARALIEKGQLDKNKLSQDISGHLNEVNQSLDPHERLQFVTVVKDVWGIENGFLTPTMKIKRAKIENVYNPKTDSWYGQKSEVIWE